MHNYKYLVFKIISLLLLIIVLGFFIRRAIARDVDVQLLQEKIKDRMMLKAPLKIPGETLLAESQLRSYYKSVNYSPSWFRGDYLDFNAGILLNFIENAGDEGLFLRIYHKSLIRNAMPRFKKWIDDNEVDSLADYEILLTDAFLSYATDAATGQFYAEGMNVNRPENIKAIPFNSLLKNGLDSQRLNLVLKHFAPASCRYDELKDAFRKYRQINAAGGFPYLPDSTAKLDPGDKGPLVSLLIDYLKKTKDISQMSNSAGLYDETVIAGVKHFQNRHGLAETGWVNRNTVKCMQIPASFREAQLIAAMERLRWLPQDLGQKYVMVNTAAFTMEIIERYNTMVKMKIIVGQPFKQTPDVHADMKYVIINPFWDVPVSIATEEILPALKRNPGYLSRNHMKIYTLGGVEINPYRVRWYRITDKYFPFKIRQLPGTWNSLGAIKFLFPNPYNVYLHGTPHQNLFDKDVRTFSHGCMRVENPMTMAEYILKNLGWDRARIEKQIDKKEEFWIVLKEPVPVYVSYRTAWISGNGNLCFRDDVYGRDAVFTPFVQKVELLQNL